MVAGGVFSVLQSTAMTATTPHVTTIVAGSLGSVLVVVVDCLFGMDGQFIRIVCLWMWSSSNAMEEKRYRLLPVIVMMGIAMAGPERPQGRLCSGRLLVLLACFYLLCS